MDRIDIGKVGRRGRTTPPEDLRSPSAEEPGIDSVYQLSAPPHSARAASGLFSGFGNAIKHLFERKPGMALQEKTARLDGETRDFLERLGSGRVDDGSWTRLGRASTDLLRSAQRSGVGNMESGATLARQQDQIVHAFKRQLPLPGDGPEIAIGKLAVVLKALSSEQAHSLAATGEAPQGGLIGDMVVCALEEARRQTARLEHLDRRSMETLKHCREALLMLGDHHSAARAQRAMVRLVTSDVLGHIGTAGGADRAWVSLFGHSFRDGMAFDRVDLASALEPLLEKKFGADFLEMIVNLSAAKSALTDAAMAGDVQSPGTARAAQDFIQALLDEVGRAYLDKFGIDAVLSNMNTLSYESLRWRAEVLRSSPVFSAALERYDDAIVTLLSERVGKHLGRLIEQWSATDRSGFEDALFQLTFACDCASDISVGKAGLLEQAFGKMMTSMTPVERERMISRLETPLPAGKMPANFLLQDELLQSAQVAYAPYRAGPDQTH